MIKEKIKQSNTESDLNQLLSRIDQVDLGEYNAAEIQEARVAIEKRRSEISARNLRSSSPVSDDTEVAPAQQLNLH